MNELFVRTNDLYMEECENTFKINVLCVGESMSGKTSIINVLVKNHFEEHTEATLVASDRNKKFISSKGTKINLKVCDTLGTKGFRKKGRSFYINVNIVFITYDIALLATFKETETYWIPEIKNILVKQLASTYIICEYMNI